MEIWGGKQHFIYQPTIIIFYENVYMLEMFIISKKLINKFLMQGTYIPKNDHKKMITKLP